MFGKLLATAKSNVLLLLLDSTVLLQSQMRTAKEKLFNLLLESLEVPGKTPGLPIQWDPEDLKGSQV